MQNGLKAARLAIGIASGLAWCGSHAGAGLSDFRNPGEFLYRADKLVHLPPPVEWRDPAIAGAGDYDGDGRSEMVVGLPDICSVYLIRGSEIESGGEMNAPDTSGIRFSPDGDHWAEGCGTAEGYDCATRGDVDGDGAPEILIGAPYRGGSVGGAYLVFGSRIREMLRTSTREYEFNGDPGRHIEFCGGGTDLQMGNTVAFSDDIDGDGRSEILIGGVELVRDAGDGFSGRGRAKVYIFHSGNVMAQYERSNRIELASADRIFAGYWRDDTAIGGIHRRCRVAGAGDMDGDGYGDILVGAGYDGEERGCTYLLLSRSLRAHGERELAPANAGYMFVGENRGDATGLYVAGGGDVDGDGVPDILLGSDRHAAPDGNLGATYFVPGGGLDPSERRVELASSGYTLCFTRSPLPRGRGLSSIAFVDDMNGDGGSEVLLGNKWRHGESGEAALFMSSGIRRSMEMGVREVYSSEAECLFHGEFHFDDVGKNVACAGDVNGDGRPDLIISAPVALYDGWDGTVCAVFNDIPDAIVVDRQVGTPDGPGTPEAPYDTIERGLHAAERWGISKVIVRGGIYREVVELSPGIEVAGELKRFGRTWLPPILRGPKPTTTVHGADRAAFRNFMVVDGRISLDGCSGMRIEENAVVLTGGMTDALRLAGAAEGNTVRNNVFAMRVMEPSSEVVRVGAGCGGNRFVNNTIHGHYVFGAVPPGAGERLLAGVYLEAGTPGNEFRNTIVEATTHPPGAAGGVYGFWAGAGAEARIEYCRTTAENRAGLGLTGGHNIVGASAGFARPLPGGVDYRLAADSPCRGAGDPAPEYVNPATRRSDMGAYGGPRSLDFK